MSDRSFLQQECLNFSAQPTKGLFVGDLSSSTTERDLQILFGAIGKVIAVEVKRGRHGDSLLHGFVEFDSEECAFSAIQTLNGLKFKGRKMRVNWTNTKVPTNPEVESWVQVQVNFMSKNNSTQVNEELLETIFSQFGPIGDVMVKRQVLSSDPVQVSGYGFIYFTDIASAINAVTLVKGISIDGVIYECVVGAQKKDEKKLGNNATSQAANSLHHNHQVYHKNVIGASMARYPYGQGNGGQEQHGSSRLNLHTHLNHFPRFTPNSLSPTTNVNAPSQNMHSTATIRGLQQQYLYTNHGDQNIQYSSSFPQHRGDHIISGNHRMNNQSRPRTFSEQQQSNLFISSMKPNMLNSHYDLPHSANVRKSLSPNNPNAPLSHPHFHLQQQQQQQSSAMTSNFHISSGSVSGAAVEDHFSFAQSRMLNQQQVGASTPSLLSFIHDHSSSRSSQVSPHGSEFSEPQSKLQSSSFDCTNAESLSLLKFSESHIPRNMIHLPSEEERHFPGLKRRTASSSSNSSSNSSSSSLLNNHHGLFMENVELTTSNPIFSVPDESSSHTSLWTFGGF